MQRRSFLRSVATGGAALTLGACASAAPNTTQAPAQGTELPTLNWDMATSWPTSLDTIFGGAERFAQRVEAMTSGKFKIKARAAGEIAKGTEVLDVVSQGAVHIDGAAVSSLELVVSKGGPLLLKVGKRRYARVTIG